MQNRHLDRYTYFCESAQTSQNFYISYLGRFIDITSSSKVLEIGCGEGGNLLPFAQKGCAVVGIDVCISRINEAIDFFSRKDKAGKFICNDFFCLDIRDKFDIILIHDVIEHINLSQKKFFLIKAKSLLKENGVIFLGFPAWQMPFGGHQQICKNKIVSHLPFIHLLPSFLYKTVLKLFGENSGCIKELLSIKQTKITIELFEGIIAESNVNIVDRCLWFINPHYKQKFNLKPRRIWGILENIKYVRNFFCTSCFYIIK